MAKKPIIRYFDRGVWYDATVSDIGNLEDLNTVHKTTVVEAINDIVGGNFTISGNLLDRLNGLDESIAGLDEMINSGTLNENQAEKINQFVVEKLNELNQSMEELNRQRDQRLKVQEEKVAQLKLDSESDKQRIEEITGVLSATKEKLNNAELNVTSVTQLVDEINGKISQAVSKTDFDLLEGTVREQKTLIDQTAESIKLLATKEELDKANENVKSIKSELDVQAGLIESKVSSEQLINEMEKIDKYMPNLLRYTRNWQDWENDDEANVDITLNEYRDCIIQRARGIGKGLSTTVEDLEIGETYSLSVWVKHDDTNAKLYAMVDNEEIIMTDLNSEETFVGNEFKRMRCSFVAQDTTAKVRFIFKNCRTDSYGYLAGAKCEKNKKVSGWQPNSEDVYQSIKSARSEIKQTDDKITTLVETVTQQGDLIASHTTSIEETDKAITLQAESIKTLNESMESAKSELKVSSDAIKSKVWKTDVGEMISDINIDNKNRVLNSDFGDGWELWSEINNLFQLKQIGNYKFAVAERSGLPQNMAIAIATNKFPVKHNERLMFGFYFYCADLSKLDNKIVGALELLDINDIRIDRVDFDVSKLSLKNGSFTKLTDTYFVEDERIVKARLRFFLNRNGNVGFALPMAQGGDIKSSDWSLAPEDVARRFNDTNVTISNYEQTVNGFKQTVESYKGSVDGYSNQVSEFNQTVNGFNQTVKDYKESNDKRVSQIESSLTTQSGKIEAVVKESAGTKDELGNLTADGGRISQLELTAQGFNTTVGEISKKVNDTNGRIDNLQVGGTNLIRNTSNQLQHLERNDWHIMISNANTKDFNLADYLGQRLTLRIYISKPSVDAKLQFYFNHPNWRAGNVIKAGQSGYSQLTVDVPTTLPTTWNIALGGGNGVAFRLDYKELKAEIGDFATSWSPHPDDLQSQVTNINNNLREQYMTIEQSNSWINQKKDSIVQGVSDRVETLGERLGNLQVGGWNFLRHSEVDLISDNIRDDWWKGTDDGKGFYTETFNANEKYLSIKAKTNNYDYGWGQWQTGFGYALVDNELRKLNVGDEISLSVDVWVSDNSSSKANIGLGFRVNPNQPNYENYFSIDIQVHPNTLPKGQWTRISTTGKITQHYKDCMANLNIIRVIAWLNWADKDMEVRFRRFKAEYGNLTTTWSPSPEDQQSQIDGINKNLTTNYYTKTDVDAQISTSKEGIVLDYRKEVQSIGMGGTNLARNTGSSWVMGFGIPNTRYDSNNGRTTLVYNSSTNMSQGAEILPQGEGFYITPINGNTYTQSLYIETNAIYNEKETFNFTWFTSEGGHNYQKGYIVKVGENTYRIWSTFKWNRSNNRLRLFDISDLYKVLQYRTSGTYISFLNPKVEIGSSPTAWSTSPEDTQSQIDGVSNNLANNYYNKQTVDSMLKVDGQGITTYVKSTKSQLDNLSVGGRNLLFKTGYFGDTQFSGIVGDSSKINLSKTIINDENSPSGKAYRVNKYKKGTENVNGGCYWQMPKKLIAGKKYTWSVYVRGSGTIGTFGPEQGGAKSVTLTSSWTKISHTFTANSSQYYQFTFYSTPEFDLYFTDLMLEEGTTPSPWQPAPEDYDDKIDGVSGNVDSLSETLGKIDTWKTEVAESFITQTANSLSTLIKDKNGASLMHFDSTSSTWSFNTSTLEKNISDAKTAGDNAQSTANSANDLANNLNNAIKDIQNKTAYITMTTYQGKPCIELGKTDNKFKVRITNESVDFLDGSTRVAYVSNNQLYIEKAIVKNEFQIGEGTGFVWKKRSNGNMGLRWGG